jgi:hypothetical protein
MPAKKVNTIRGARTSVVNLAEMLRDTTLIRQIGQGESRFEDKDQGAKSNVTKAA